MAAIGFVLHHTRDAVADKAAQALVWLIDRGHEVRLPKSDAELIDRPDLAFDDETFGTGLDAVAAIGGDGTILRAAALVAGTEVPIAGINAGQMGYLASVEPDGLAMALKRFLNGSYSIEERMMVRATMPRADADTDEPFDALNEVVVEKAETGHTVRLEVAIDGSPFTTYETDGLIVATPTGSTAYSLSARGPIVSPRHRALLLTPVSPHMLFDRSLVLAPTESVTITVEGHRPAALVADGRVVANLAAGDTVDCTVSPLTTHLLSFGPHNFHQILKNKFGLADR